MPRKKNVTSHSAEDILFAKNLLSVLTKYPYRDYFINFLKKYFEDVLDKNTVDIHINHNKKQTTGETFDSVAKSLIRFALTFHPDNANNIISNFYENQNAFKIKESLNMISAKMLTDEEYMQHLKDSSEVIRSFCGKNMYKRGGIHIITAPPAGGKTLFLLQEAVYQSLFNNMRILFFVVGDMDEASVSYRIKNILDYYEKIFDNINRDNLDRLSFYIYPSHTISAQDIANEIKRLEESRSYETDMIDMVIIDYDDNLANFSSKDNMYISAALPYQIMDEHKYGKVIIFASQSKVGSFRREDEYTSLGMLASSSKKEHIADQIYSLIYKRSESPSFEDKIKHVLKVNKDRHNLHEGKRVIAELDLSNGVFLHS
ncbi:MAG: hypothetical protein QXS19_06960 [Candidatus Methanomethylicia archaeon]